MKHWLKCLLVATSIFAIPSSTPSLAISAPHPSMQTGLRLRAHAELVTSAAGRLINRPAALSRMEQLLLFSFSLGLVGLQLHRKHEILIAPRVPM